MLEWLKARLCRKELAALATERNALLCLEDQLEAELKKATLARKQANALHEKAKKVVDAAAIEKQWETCKTKVHYGTEEAAQYAALALFYKEERMVSEYRCVCGRWCLTTSTKASALVNADLVHKHHARPFNGRSTAKIGDILKSKMS